MASSTTLSLTPTNWYTAKVVVDDDPNDAALQRLRFWVDTDNDADFSDETAMIDTTVVDDDWSGGGIGLFRYNTVTAATQFDDFTAGLDNNADGDIDDGGDDVLVSDDFNSAA